MAGKLKRYIGYGAGAAAAGALGATTGFFLSQTSEASHVDQAAAHCVAATIPLQADLHTSKYNADQAKVRHLCPQDVAQFLTARVIVGMPPAEVQTEWEAKDNKLMADDQRTTIQEGYAAVSAIAGLVIALGLSINTEFKGNKPRQESTLVVPNTIPEDFH